ncbi:MAG: Crp/Fnr family transcriptional regulator [Dokdonella sp.]
MSNLSDCGVAENALLAAFSAKVIAALRPHLELHPLAIGESLYMENAAQTYVYFPISGIVSIVYVLSDGATGELAIVGNDGLVGLAAFMEGQSAAHRAVVQVEGHCYRVKAKILTELFRTDKAVSNILLRYIQVVLVQLAQTAICNRNHTLTQQFCRWILLSLDRLDTNVVKMTQQLIAEMLGVRREGVSVIAGQLRDERLIEYSRGTITVLDRKAVEDSVCECYAAVRAETRRLLPEAHRRSNRAR